MIPLDGAPAAGGRRAAVREREDAVVTSLRSLGPALDGEPDPAFRAATRARLVAMAAVRTPEPAPAPAWSPVRRRLTAGLAGGALAVTALATLVAVATGASPGDPLYDLKRGTEQTQLALSGSDRGLTLLGFAHTRLTELASLAGTADTELAVRALRDMDDETTRGTAAVTARAVGTRDPATARLLASWGGDQSTQLTGLQPQLPAGARSAADRSAALFAAVTDRGTALATALECSTGPALAGTDPLGPVPLTCAAGAVPPTATPLQGDTGTGSSTGVPAPAPGATGTQAIPTPATGAAGGDATGSGTAGPGPGPGGIVPTVPGLPTTGFPRTTLPRTSTAPVPPAGTPPLPAPGPLLPTSPAAVPPLLPGAAPAAGSGSPGTGPGTAGLPGVPVCVPPLTLGSC